MSTKPKPHALACGCYHTIRIVEAYELSVYSNVIYLRPEAGRNDLGHYRQDLENHRIFIEYQVLRLADLDGQQVLDAKHVGLLPFTPLMKSPTGCRSRGLVEALCSSCR